jgi:hypothetical protein
MSLAPERAMLGRGHPVRLVQTLVKAGLILAVIAATLGGAVALGSTLFEAPPRDAAEFAARVEAGSTHAPPTRKLTAAERRYVLDLADLCAARNERLRGLERRVKSVDVVGRLRGWRAIFADYSENFAALPAPRRYEAGADRVGDLGRAMLDLTDGALEAKRAGDREGFEAKTRAAELLDARYDEAVLRLDSPACITA